MSAKPPKRAPSADLNESYVAHHRTEHDCEKRADVKQQQHIARQPRYPDQSKDGKDEEDVAANVAMVSSAWIAA